MSEGKRKNRNNAANSDPVKKEETKANDATKSKGKSDKGAKKEDKDKKTKTQVEEVKEESQEHKRIEEDDRLGSDSMSNDIKIERFDISYPGNVLFKDATLLLGHGRKYGLVAPNGTGKSTLLTYIAQRKERFIEIPKHFDIHYVEQEVIGDETTALDCVIAADENRLKLMAEEQRLLESDELDAGERLMKIYQKLDEIQAYSAEARASSILTGLQFTEEMKKKKTKEFSGGWRMRISIARALFRRPTLLLLDEPTNHLDLLAVIWLESYLAKWKNTLLIVSHDQDFLNTVCTDIIHLHDQKLHYYKGNYDKFKKLFTEHMTQLKKDYEKQKKALKQAQQQESKKQDQKKRVEKVKQDSKALKNKHREQEGRAGKGKELEDSDDKKLLTAPKDYNVQFSFPEPDPLGIPIIQVNDASFGYTPDKLLFKDLNFGIDMESRIAMVGPNGAGKSTLLKLLSGELTPTDGSIAINRKLIIGKFTQHFVDKLDYDQSPVEYLKSQFQDLSDHEVRQMLGRFGLTGQVHVRKISSLSGGQKSRVVFAELSMRAPHLLFLDEPTNHLDIESIDALAEALNEFKGGIVLVSHDARLISEVCSDVWVVGDNTVTRFEGDFDDYRAELVEEFEEREREEEEKRKEKEEERKLKRQEELQAKLAKLQQKLQK